MTKSLDWSKLKAFADNKTDATEKSKLVMGRVENIVVKGENAGHQHFLIFPQCFQRVSYTGSLKFLIVCVYTSRLGSERSVDLL